MAELDNYISMFKTNYENITNAKKRANIYLIFTAVVLLVFLAINQISEIFGYIAGAVAIAFVVGFIYLTRITSRFPLAGWLTYSLCQLYEGIKEINEVKEEGLLIQEKRKDLLSKGVSGPIKGLKSMIILRESAPKYLLFKAREISLLRRTRKSLENRIYPNIKDGNEDQTQRYLGPLIKSLIDLNFDQYEVALSQLEKMLPEREVKIPEMRTFADTMIDLRRYLLGYWVRSSLFRFLVLCPVIGLIFIVGSFLIKIEAGVGLATTVAAAAVLAAKTGGSK